MRARTGTRLLNTLSVEVGTASDRIRKYTRQIGGVRTASAATGSETTRGRSEYQNRERSDRIGNYTRQIGVSEPRAQPPDRKLHAAERVSEPRAQPPDQEIRLADRRCQNRERSDRIGKYAWQIGVSRPRAQRPDQEVRLADRKCQNRERSDRIGKYAWQIGVSRPGAQRPDQKVTREERLHRFPNN